MLIFEPVMLSGYRGPALRVLKRAGVSVGDYVEIASGGRVYRGILMPRYELADDRHITLKLDNGYNIGVRVAEDTRVTLVSRGVGGRRMEGRTVEGGEKTVVLLGTGGTILSRIDYTTGAVKPSFTVEDLVDMVPGVGSEYRVELREVMNIFSEDMRPSHWSVLAREIAGRVGRGVDGVVIAHGTDTMGYTAAALSFALRGLPVPVVLVGSQRSSDRPSSDAALNLRAAFRYAGYGEYAGVFVAMHGWMSDEEVHIHRGTRVRKLHTSRRDAFKSVNSKIVAKVVEDRIEYVDTSLLLRRGEGKLDLKPRFEERVALIKIYPGIGGDVIDHFVDSGYRGIVLEGTGLGHTPRALFRSIERAVKSGVVVAMSSQCIWGRINMNVYSTGRELQRIGVIGVEDMLPETALVKLMWVLGQTESYGEAVRLMRENLVGEYSARSLPGVS